MDTWRIPASVSLAILFFGWAKVSAAPSEAAGKNLDTAAIHKIYVDGDFDQAIGMLKPALDGSYRLSHEDSVFIFKHLGVMYAAKYETREKGKKYMMLLLQTEPTVRIMDMYASDMIYMIFKNLQDEYSLSLAKMKRAQGHVQGNAQAELPVDSVKTRPENHAWAYWTGGALLAVGGIALTVYLTGDPEPVKHEHIIK